METQTEKPVLSAAPEQGEEVKPQTIKLSYGQIRHGDFMSAYQLLLGSQLPYQAQRNLLAMAKLINEERNDCQTKINEMWSIYGEYYTPEDSFGKQAVSRRIKKENEETANQKIKELMDVEFELGFKKLSPVLLTHFDLNAGQLVALEPLFTEDLVATPDQVQKSSSSQQPLAVQ